MSALAKLKATIKKIDIWLHFRRECAWCHTLKGGNIFARHVTHTICDECEKKFWTEVTKGDQ